MKLKKQSENDYYILVFMIQNYLPLGELNFKEWV